MKTLSEVAAVLEQSRKQQKLSYDALAEASGLTPLATRRALKAQAAPKVTTLMALADRLGLEVVLVPKAVAHGLTPTPAEQQRPLSAVEKLAARMQS